MPFHVDQKEWDVVKEYLMDKPDGTKYSRKMSRLPHSFIKLNNQIYAVQPHAYLGKGVHGKSKLVQDEEGHIFVAKITYGDASFFKMPINSYLAHKLGHANRSLKRESKILNDINLRKGYNKRLDVRKEVLVMEYLGEAFVHFIKNQKLNNADEAELAFKLIKHLDDLHTGNLSKTNTRYIHGDLKEDNITVDEQQNIHFVDFGLTKRATDSRDGLIRGVRQGTVPYMAPETQSYQGLSFKSDIYSMGVIFKNNFKQNIILKELAAIMTHEDPEQRPSTDLLQKTLIALCGQVDYEELSQYKAIAAILLASSSDQKLWNEMNLQKIQSNEIVCKTLAACFEYLRKSKGVFHGDLGRKMTKTFIQNIISNNLTTQEIEQETMHFLQGSGKYQQLFSGSSHHKSSRLSFLYDFGLLNNYVAHKNNIPFASLSKDERKNIERQVKQFKL